ncbi:hypothetical protein STEG23_015049, partial [Scotinomys teguina]
MLAGAISAPKETNLHLLKWEDITFIQILRGLFMSEVGLFSPGSKGKRGRLFWNYGGWYE